jgi:hypothetical protein
MFNSESHAVYEITWRNVVDPYRPRMTIWRMRIACWIPKVTNTHSEYVILLFHRNSGYANGPELYIIVLRLFCLKCHLDELRYSELEVAKLSAARTTIGCGASARVSCECPPLPNKLMIPHVLRVPSTAEQTDDTACPESALHCRTN